MSVRDELVAYRLDSAGEAERLGRMQAQRDWPRLPDAAETLGHAHHAYARVHRRVRRQLNRATFVAAFTVAHLETLIALDEGREPYTRPGTHFRRGGP